MQRLFIFEFKFFFYTVGEAPIVDFCPESQKFKIQKHHDSIKVAWIEPKFSDNVNITEIRKTNV